MWTISKIRNGANAPKKLKRCGLCNSPLYNFRLNMSPREADRLRIATPHLCLRCVEYGIAQYRRRWWEKLLGINAPVKPINNGGPHPL
jgi:hypothetical protein